jgi:deoxyribonuclease V
VSAWPQTRGELIEEQLRLGALDPPTWQFTPEARVGGVFVCFARGASGPGSAGDPACARCARLRPRGMGSERTRPAVRSHPVADELAAEAERSPSAMLAPGHSHSATSRRCVT